MKRSPHAPAIEWLLAIDVVELSWEIQRYRALRHKHFEHHRQEAIEYTLSQIDLAGIPAEQDAAIYHIRRNAQAWRTDPTSAAEIEERLLTHGYDPSAINTEVFMQAREMFLVFGALLNTAQNRRISLLREIDYRRYAKYPLRRRPPLRPALSSIAPLPAAALRRRSGSRVRIGLTGVLSPP